jgi:hypothetical protein
MSTRECSICDGTGKRRDGSDCRAAIHLEKRAANITSVEMLDVQPGQKGVTPTPTQAAKTASEPSESSPNSSPATRCWHCGATKGEHFEAIKNKTCKEYKPS